jgi:hypothetical protein
MKMRMLCCKETIDREKAMFDECRVYRHMFLLEEHCERGSRKGTTTHAWRTLLVSARLLTSGYRQL